MSSRLPGRRPLLVLAVLAVLVVALSWSPGAHARPGDATGSRFSVDYFALGDSVASGRGLGDFGSCRRSARAYPRKVRAALEDRHGLVRFRMLACSGATATGPEDAGLLSLRFQVSRALAELSRRPTLVSVTIGVNDFRWSEITLTYFRLRSDEASFEEWRRGVTAEVRASLRTELRRLLARPNVSIVLTQYHNPVNTESILFGPPLPCEDVAGCYERTERIVHGLNGAFERVRRSLAAPGRVGIALIHRAFHGHESPLPVCGTALPGTGVTWIQHPQDPLSDSFPPVPPEIEALTGDWRGDCFHPNEQGAEAIANAVDRVALSLGR